MLVYVSNDVYNSSSFTKSDEYSSEISELLEIAQSYHKVGVFGIRFSRQKIVLRRDDILELLVQEYSISSKLHSR